MSEDQPELDIAAWIKRCIEGPGGMNDYKSPALAFWDQPERITIASWIIRCLGDPQCEGACQVVEALNRRHGIPFIERNPDTLDTPLGTVLLRNSKSKRPGVTFNMILCDNSEEGVGDALIISQEETLPGQPKDANHVTVRLSYELRPARIEVEVLGADVSSHAVHHLSLWLYDDG